MPRKQKIGGLDPPLEPVNIDEPRASRHKPANAINLVTSSLVTNAPPTEVLKPLTSASPKGATSTSMPPESGAAPAPDATKKRRKKKQSAPVLDPDQEMEDALSEPAKPSKAKKDNTQPIVVGQITMDDFLDPAEPAPPKRKREQKVPASTSAVTIGATDAPTPAAAPPPKKRQKSKKAAQQDGDIEMDPPDNPVASDQAGTATTTGTSGRIKQPSSLAKKVAAQEATKQSNKVAEAQRKLEKAQRATVYETPEATAAFLANAQTPSIHTTISVASIQAQPSTSELQRSKKEDMKQLIRQRTQNRVKNPAPPSSSSVASTSVHGASQASVGLHSRGTSLVPPSRVAPVSRGSSAVPSVRSESIPPSNLSRRTPSEPVARSTPAEATNSPAEGVSTLAEYYLDIPEEFAPRRPRYDPLPEPLRDVERIRPVPELEITQLDATQQREYRKALKLELKDLTPTDHVIVSSALSRLEALMNTINCFPSSEDLFHYMLVANAWACRKHNLGNLILIEGSPYEELLFARSSQMRTAILKAVCSKVPLRYRFSADKTDKATQSNASKATYQLVDANFVCPSNDLGALYENNIFQDIFESAFFTRVNSAGVTHRDLWKTITIPALAMAATAIEKVLMDYVHKGTNVDAKPVPFSWKFFADGHCQTATGDEKLPDEAIHLASGMLMAGYSSVIATMWSVMDDDAPFVADRFYERLMKNGTLGNGEAGMALHDAVGELRERIGEREFRRWVPYIHIGS